MSTLRGFTPPDRGALFVVTGPSGTGKTTLVRAALERLPGLDFSVSATTRPPRAGDVPGRDYDFVDDAAFDRLVADEALLEWAMVYGNRYGTPREPVERALAEGRSVLLDIDLRGARQVVARVPEAVTVFLLPPDLDTLRRRLRGRGSDAPEVVERRLMLAQEQLAGCGEFEYMVVNDVLDTAHRVFEGILLAEMSRVARRGSWVRMVGGVTPA